METTELYGLFAEAVNKLRRRLLALAVLFAVAGGVGYCLADNVMHYLFKMVRQVIFISPTEAFITKIKVSLALGLVFMLPVLLHLILGVIRTRATGISLRSHYLLTLLSFLLFIIGAAFCLFAALPVGINFLLDFATLEMQPLLSAGRFISFAITCLLIFGAMFELPLFIMLLVSLGILTPDALKAKRRHAILIIFIVAGFLTPSPDVISQVMLAVPMLGLYEAGISLARLCRKPEEAAPPQMPPDQQQIFM